MSWITDVLDWDESQDPSQAPDKALTAPWRALGARDRQLLDLLADGEWVSEVSLRGKLGWGRGRFFITTIRMILVGWIKARPADSPLRSEYRLSAEVWK